MKIFINITLLIFMFLAISSGITKIMLMQPDVELFGKYGFTSPILITYGLTQLLGGIFLVIPKTKAVGALVVNITFLISAVVLVMAGNIPLAIITVICVILLGIVIKQVIGIKNIESNDSDT